MEVNGFDRLRREVWLTSKTRPDPDLPSSIMGGQVALPIWQLSPSGIHQQDCSEFSIETPAAELTSGSGIHWTFTERPHLELDHQLPYTLLWMYFIWDVDLKFSTLNRATPVAAWPLSFPPLFYVWLALSHGWPVICICFVVVLSARLTLC